MDGWTDADIDTDLLLPRNALAHSCYSMGLPFSVAACLGQQISCLDCHPQCKCEARIDCRLMCSVYPLLVDSRRRIRHLDPLSTSRPRRGRRFLCNISSLGRTFLIQKGQGIHIPALPPIW